MHFRLLAPCLALAAACDTVPEPPGPAAIVCIGPNGESLVDAVVTRHPERSDGDREGDREDDAPFVVLARGAGLIGSATIDAQHGAEPCTVHMGKEVPIRGRVRTPSGWTGTVDVSVTRMQIVYLQRELDRFQLQGFERRWSQAARHWLPRIDALDAQVRADGSFELVGCAEPVLLGFTAPGLAMAERWTSGTGALLDVQMDREARIKVHVADHALDSVGGADVQVWTFVTTCDAIPGGEPRSWARRTGPEGTATFDGLPAGPFFVVVQARESALHLSRTTVAAGSAASVAVRLDAGVLLRGRVRDANGRGAANARVTASFVDPQVAAADARTDEHGCYTMRVPRESLVLRVGDLPDGWRDAAGDRPLSFAGSGTQEATVDLEVVGR